jgi:aminoglycoside 3-N-acetyltransferase
LLHDFTSLGVARGQNIMLHSSVKAVGAVMGGPNVILQALFDALGKAGTLMMYAGWQDIPDFVLDLPVEARQTYYDEHPPFDPVTARAVRENGILAEFLRTWPGAKRSLNPEASMVAVGALAEQLTQDHPLDYGYGAGSPLAKLVENKGKVLMLGAPLDTITLLHYAENRARMAHKHIVRFQCPILRDGHKLWIDVEDFNTGEVHADYTFDGIARDYLVEGRGRQGVVGNADSYLLDAADLAAFAIRWLEARFG